MTATDPIRTTRKTKVKVKSTAEALKAVADHADGKEQHHHGQTVAGFRNPQLCIRQDNDVVANGTVNANL